MYLEQIAKAKRREVDCLKKHRPPAELERAALDMPGTRDFAGALAGRGCAVIAEVKRRSPSRGVIRDPFDPVAIACRYEQGGAAAISVLTDEAFFGGQGSFIAAIQEAVNLPLLRKDFIIDACQIYETRALGADAVLLIAAILDDDTLRHFIELAELLGLAPLVEVHTMEDVEKAMAGGARIVGINNRDLVTFATDLSASRELIAAIPGDRIVVSESGIATRGDIAGLMAAGIHAFLIGETLMSAADPGAKLQELLGRDGSR